MDLRILPLTFGISFIFQYLIQKLFIYYNKYDKINTRSSHVTLSTRTGGIGIYISVLFISIFHYLIKIDLFDYSLFIPLSIMFVVGVYDDLYSADFRLKFFLQLIVCKILIDQGYLISNFYGFLGIYEVPRIIAQITSAFVFLVVVNSINFIDGIDGLAITEIIKSILILNFLVVDNQVFFNLSFICVCSIIPLYYYNFKKQKKVFLGDAGSLYLGTLLMIIVFEILNPLSEIKLELNKTLTVILVLFYPLVDLFRVFFLRIINKKSPFLPDNNHIHHLLIKKGWSHLKTVTIIFFVFSFPLLVYLFSH